MNKLNQILRCSALSAAICTTATHAVEYQNGVLPVSSEISSLSGPVSSKAEKWLNDIVRVNEKYSENTRFAFSKAIEQGQVSHYVYEQVLNNIPVKNAVIIVSIDWTSREIIRLIDRSVATQGMQVESMSSFIKNSDKNVVDGDQVKQIVLDALTDQGNPVKTPLVNFTYYPTVDTKTKQNQLILAYKALSEFKAPKYDWIHIVSATTGKILSTEQITQMDAFSRKALRLDTVKNTILSGKTGDEKTKIEDAFNLIIQQATFGIAEETSDKNIATSILLTAQKLDPTQTFTPSLFTHFEKLGIVKSNLILKIDNTFSDKNDRAAYPGDTLKIYTSMENPSPFLVTDSSVEIFTMKPLVEGETRVALEDIEAFSAQSASQPLTLTIPNTVSCGEEVNYTMRHRGQSNGVIQFTDQSYSLTVGNKVYARSSSLGTTGIPGEHGSMVELRMTPQPSSVALENFKSHQIKDLELSIVYISESQTIEQLNPQFILNSPSGDSIQLTDENTKYVLTGKNSIGLRFSKNNQPVQSLTSLNGKQFDGEWSLQVFTDIPEIPKMFRAEVRSVYDVQCPTAPKIVALDKQFRDENRLIHFRPTVSNPLALGMTYSWKQVDDSGYKVEIMEPVIAEDLEFTSPKVDKNTTLQFELTAKNDRGFESKQIFEFEIINKVETNLPPVVEPLPKSIKIVSGKTLSLSAKASDKDDMILLYTWKLNEKVIGNDKNLNTKVPTVTAETIMTLSLTVSDGHAENDRVVKTMLIVQPKETDTTDTDDSNDTTKPTQPESPSDKDTASKKDSGGSMFYMITALLGLLQIRRRRA